MLINPVQDIRHLLSWPDLSKNKEKLRKYKGLSEINVTLQDIIYRLFPPQYHDYHTIITVCNETETIQNKYFSQLIKAICLVFTQDLEKAEKIFKQLIEEDPKCSHPLYHLACICIIKDDWKNANHYLGICLQIDSDNNEAHVLIECCNIKYLDPYYDNIIEKPTNLFQFNWRLQYFAQQISNKDQRCFQAFFMLSSHSSDKLVEICDNYLKIIPYCYAAYLQKGQFAMNNGSWKLAETHLEKALKLNPNSSSVLSCLSMISLNKNDLQEVFLLEKRMSKNTIVSKAEKNNQFIMIRSKILAMNFMGKHKESISLCNKKIKELNYNKDFVELKLQLLEDKQSQAFQYINRQLELLLFQSYELRVTQLQFVVFLRIISQYMTFNPTLAFIDFLIL